MGVEVGGAVNVGEIVQMGVKLFKTVGVEVKTGEWVGVAVGV